MSDRRDARDGNQELVDDLEASKLQTRERRVRNSHSLDRMPGVKANHRGRGPLGKQQIELDGLEMQAWSDVATGVEGAAALHHGLPRSTAPLDRHP